MNRGKFVTIEGIEGVGKSTHMELIEKYCARNAIDAVFTREPGGTEIAERIRELILSPQNKGMDAICELLLYEAARCEHIDKLIKPAINAGKVVFCDRFIDSTFAYQSFGRGISASIVNSLNAIATASIKIDCTIFLNLKPKDGFLRKGGADKNDRLEGESLEFFERVYKGFLQAKACNEDRFIQIDAQCEKQVTHQKIIDALVSRGIL